MLTTRWCSNISPASRPYEQPASTAASFPASTAKLTPPTLPAHYRMHDCMHRNSILLTKPRTRLPAYLPTCLPACLLPTLTHISHSQAIPRPAICSSTIHLFKHGRVKPRWQPCPSHASGEASGTWGQGGTGCSCRSRRHLLRTQLLRHGLLRFSHLALVAAQGLRCQKWRKFHVEISWWVHKR